MSELPNAHCICVFSTPDKTKDVKYSNYFLGHPKAKYTFRH